MPDQIELVAGDEALADEHLVERRANREHVRGGDQAFIRLVLVRSVLGSGAARKDSVAAVPATTKQMNPSNSGVDMPLASTDGRLPNPTLSVQMSAGFEVGTAIGVSQPRRAVIDRAWRAIGPGVEVLSGDDGGPLRRTVKRILDPLVLRLRANTQYSAPFVDAEWPWQCTT